MSQPPNAQSTIPVRGTTARPASQSAAAPGRVRQARMRTSGATLERLANREMLVRPQEALEAYPRVLTDRLAHWAESVPNRICAARRDGRGEWRCVNYGQLLSQVRSVGQALLDRGLSADRPVVILSENDLHHLVLMLAGQHAGTPRPAFRQSTRWCRRISGSCDTRSGC